MHSAAKSHSALRELSKGCVRVHRQPMARTTSAAHSTPRLYPGRCYRPSAQIISYAWNTAAPTVCAAYRADRRFRRVQALYLYSLRRGKAAWVSNQTEPRSCPPVRRTSALRAAARRRRRGMVGSVPPSSMRSMSSSVRAARWPVRRRSAEGGADVVQGLAERQGLADRDALGISAASWGRAQRVW